MSINYQKQLPKDRGGDALQEFPAPFLAVKRTTSENATVSSVITLSDQTTSLEVTALGVGAALRWVPATDTQASVVTAVSGANYDHVIPPNTMRRFVVPQEFIPTPSIAGANVANGCYARVAYRSFGIGSIMSSEF